MKFLKTFRSCNVNLVYLLWFRHTIKFVMPRKSKKAKFKPQKVQVNQYGEIFSNSGAVNGTSPGATLNYFFEIFSDKIEKDVIKLVLDECDFNVDQASETLMSLCNDGSREKPEYDLKITEENNLGYGFLPYYNNVFPDLNSYKTGAFSENPNNGSTITTQVQVFQEVGNQNFVDDSWSEFFASGKTSFGECSSVNDHLISETQLTPIINDKKSEATTSTSYLNPNAPSFIVPMLPMHHGSPPLHRSPGLETKRAVWNSPDSKHFSSSATKVPRNKKSNTNPVIKNVCEKIKCGCHILIILRGLPGSGKSTLAVKLKFSGVIFSSDDFFMKKGKYVFDPSRLSEAHEWNRLRTKLALKKGITPIIIDNTNTEAWEMKPYVFMGKQHNYEVVILEPDTPWKFNVNSLALRNKHGVPKSKIALMKERYEYDITVDKILATSSAAGPFSSNLKCTKNEDIKSEVTNGDSYVGKSNHISLKAVVHTEHNSIEENSQTLLGNEFQSSEDKKITETDSKNKENDMQSNALDWENSVTCQTVTICNLDELRALAKNDSEDSQSCYSSSNCSSQEVSGWEAITEHDNDFQWSTSSNNLNSKSSWKSRSVNDLYLKESTESSVEDVINFTQSSSENILNNIENRSVTNEFENIFKPLPIRSNLHKEEKNINSAQVVCESEILQVHDSEYECFNQYVESNVGNFHMDKNTNDSAFCDNFSQIQKLWNNYEENITEVTNHLNDADLNNNEDDSFNSSTESLIIHEETIPNTDDVNQKFNLAPKPPRNNCSDLLKLNKDYFSNQVISDEPEAIADENNSDLVDSDWSSIDNKNDELNLENHSKITSNEEEVLIAKPQRELFKNSLSVDEDNNSDKVPYTTKKKSLLNISPDLIGQVWTFPELVIDSSPQQVNSEKKILSFKMSVSCQTEPRDFDYLYKISSGNGHVNLIGYNIIFANRLNCTEILEKSDNLNLSKDSDKYSSTGSLSFDKSTSTDDMVDDIEISQKLTHLQSCFPDISKEDILHLLEICYNDERWISNLLLDWGYKYNVPVENLDVKTEEVITNCRKKYNVNSNVYEDGIDFSVWKTNALSKSSTGSSLDVDLTSSKSSSEETTEAQSTEEDEETKVKFQLVLDSTFAHQLQQLFGSFPNSENRKVDVDFEFAKLIYEKWKNTIPHAEDSIKDEKSDLNNSKSRSKKVKQSKINNEKPIRNLPSCKNGDSSFSEIMDMEFARQLHIEETLEKVDDFTTKMKRSELYNMFPGADSIVLDEIFESNNYSLENSLHVLGADISQQETIEKKRNVEKFDAQIKEWEKTNIFREFENGDWSDWVYQDDNPCSTQEIVVPVLSTTVSAKAAALREEAAEHYQLRQEYIQKAQAAYCRGMKDVASFYAQQGTEEGRIAKSTNKLAAALIAQERNSSSPVLKIDLHGLHIQEAISLLEKFLYDKKLEIRRRLHTTPVIVTVITGQGIHSAQGAKLRPAVLNYLRSSKYSFSEIKTGQVEVTLISDFVSNLTCLS